VVGESVGDYLILAELGSGAMANVYRVRDMRTNGVFAMKVLHPFLNESATIVERFRREASVIAQLDHPHIVTFHDYVEIGETFGCVMELLAAQTLEEILEATGRLNDRFAVSVVRQLASALRFAHGCKVIHRDIKPSNVFVVEGRGVVLTDFGFAKPLTASALTVDGAKMMGTPYYMAPEQVAGAPTDERTDIYQMGILFFQLVTGRIPFAELPPFEAISARCAGRPTFTDDDRASVGAPVRAIIERATSPRPDERFQSADELYEAVSAVRRAAAVTSPG